MQHSTTQPPSAKRRIAKATLEESTNMAGGAVESATEESVFVDYHDVDKGNFDLTSDDLPDGWGITAVECDNSTSLITVGIGWE